MTIGTSNDENESAPSEEHFAKFMESLGAKMVKRMGTPQELASVGSPFPFVAVTGGSRLAYVGAKCLYGV